MTLGGGLEVCLGAGDVQAAAETYAGLVEVGVGLVPGGGGTMNLLWRALEGVPDGATLDTYALVTQVFKNIAMVRVGDERRGGEGLRLLPARRPASASTARASSPTRRRAPSASRRAAGTRRRRARTSCRARAGWPRWP